MSEQTPRSPEEKRKAHFAKAKKAVLKLVADKDGKCPMSDMHDLSESQFFIAHQQFSLMMEECVEEELIELDAYDVTLTEAGRAFAEGGGDA